MIAVIAGLIAVIAGLVAAGCWLRPVAVGCGRLYVAANLLVQLLQLAAHVKQSCLDALNGSRTRIDRTELVLLAVTTRLSGTNHG